MKLIVAIIRREHLAAVEAALNKRGISLMTVSDVLGRSQEQGPTQIYRGREFRRPVAKVRLEIAVEESMLDTAVEVIARTGCADKLGQGGDGKILVMGLEQCVRIHTGERDAVTLGP